MYNKYIDIYRQIAEISWHLSLYLRAADSEYIISVTVVAHLLPP